MGSYQELVENSLNQSGITGLPTGFDELNRRTGGFMAANLFLSPDVRVWESRVLR